jgi:hypothetical protein
MLMASLDGPRDFLFRRAQPRQDNASTSDSIRPPMPFFKFLVLLNYLQKRSFQYGNMSFFHLSLQDSHPSVPTTGSFFPRAARVKFLSPFHSLAFAYTVFITFVLYKSALLSLKNSERCSSASLLVLFAIFLTFVCLKGSAEHSS